MNSKIIISFIYALIFTVWPPDNAGSQTKEKETVKTEEFEFDSAAFYELQEERRAFKQVAGTTLSVQREAMKNLSRLEKQKKIKFDTVYVPVYIPVYDTSHLDTIKHKKNFFQRLFN